MTECTSCGTLHGTQSYQEDGETATYCPGCAPPDADPVEDAAPVVEHPDRR